MGKANSTFVRPLWMASLFALALFLAPTTIFAQDCGCQDNVIVTLDDECEFTLTAAQVKAGTSGDCDHLDVVVNDWKIESEERDVINGAGTFEYGLFDGDDLVCWGTVTAEDKTPPVVEAPSNVTLECWLVDLVLNESETLKDDGLSDGIGFLGLPTVVDACDGELSFEWADAIEYGTCEDDYYAVITRRFTATDSHGNSATDIQKIKFATVDPGAFNWVTDANDNDGVTFLYDDDAGKWVLTVQDCSPDSGDRPANKYPRYTDAFGRKVYLNEAGCNLSVNDDYRLFDNVCSNGSFKEERTIKVFDWCEGGTVEPDFHYIVKVGDFEAPEFEDCVWQGKFLDGEKMVISRLDKIANRLNDRDKGIIPRKKNWDDICLEKVSTGPMDCTAAINTSLSALRALFGNDIVTDCETPTITTEIFSYVPETVGGFPTGDTIWQVGGYSTQGQMAVGIPQGYHMLIISASDGCYNADIGAIFFEVWDGTKPVMKCDDELRVTLVDGDAKLGINGYAQVTAYDVDEGSWDNCFLKELKVRRAVDNTSSVADDYEAKYGSDYREDYIEDTGYSKWDDIAEFFCGDLEAPVTVELKGRDKHGNESTCWLTVDVENGLNYEVKLEGGGWITCLEEVTQDNVYDFVTVSQYGIQCAGPEVGVTITPELDQCGVGRYRIDLAVDGGEDTKNDPYVDPYPVYVSVYAVHDYWIKFPADEAYDCGADQDISGVETSGEFDVACDLLAISTQPDEIFTATTDPDACYKIFRTYRVINWCEYDGEALPVIVSRDWDAHNGYTGCNRNGNTGDTDTKDAGEYNLNPQEPDGDGVPGDEDLYVIVKVNDHDGTGTVYYDNDSDPYNTSTADVVGDPNRNNTTTSADFEGYWWAVTRKDDCRGTDSSVWYDDEDPNDGSEQQDDDDNRYGSHGFWQYTQHIIVYDDTAPEVTINAEETCSINNFDCAAETSFTIVITDVCSVEDIGVEVTVNGDEETPASITTSNDTVTVTVTGRRGLGKYDIVATVNDGCGNETVADASFDVVDCKAPAPICHDGIVVELMPAEEGGGMMAVWASDFIGSAVGDCTGQDDAQVPVGNGVTNRLVVEDAYSIYFEDSIAADTAWEYVSPFDDESVRGITLTCDHLAGADENLVMVRVYAEDMADNADYCVTFVRVQDNIGACDVAAGTGQIAGAVETEDANKVEGVEVQLSGNASMIYMTNDNGTFTFNNLPSGYDYTVTPTLDENPLNGVSTFDLVLISKHILGVQQLNSAYKLIAADVNNSKSVTTLDLIQLRKLILNIDTEFANNTSWRFVDASYEFQTPSNPWTAAFPEFKNFNNLDALSQVEFVGVKVGDVNGSANVEARSATKTLDILADDQAMIAGNEYRVDFTADMSNIEGYQFTLNVKNAEIVDVIEGAAKAENFGVFTKEGVITTSFNGAAAGTLFSVVVRATADANLSEALTINSRYTAAEAYTTDAEQLNVALNFGQATAQAAGFELIQNTPNPFKGETVIGFNLPESAEATITLQDVAGRTIKVIEGDFVKGYNQVKVKANDLPSTGVFFYTLTVGELTATKKLITVE